MKYYTIINIRFKSPKTHRNFPYKSRIHNQMLKVYNKLGHFHVLYKRSNEHYIPRHKLKSSLPHTKSNRKYFETNITNRKTQSNIWNSWIFHWIVWETGRTCSINGKRTLKQYETAIAIIEYSNQDKSYHTVRK